MWGLKRVALDLALTPEIVEPTQYDYPLFMSSHRDLFHADTRFLSTLARS